MKIRITDIPHEGLAAQFPLNVEAVNLRVAGDRSSPGEVAFTADPEVSIEIALEGRTVHLGGAVSGELRSPCARCTEPAFERLEVQIGMALKPESERERDAVEDIDFGYYSGDEIDCAGVAEEALMLAIPYVSVCSDSCKGLCPVCGANKNLTGCNCRSSETLDSPFRVLKDLKILQ